MNLNRFYLIFFILICIIAIRFFDETKGFLRDFLPYYTKSYVNELLYKQSDQYVLKAQAYNAMKDYFVIPNKPALIKTKSEYIERYPEIRIDILETNFLNKIKNAKAKGGSYLALHNGNLIIAQENGLIFYLKSSEIGLDKSSLSLSNIPTNLFSLIRFYDFYGQGQYGVKGLLFDEKYLYLSVSFEVEENCFNTSILKAEMNQKFLNFKTFFVPNNCVKKKNVYGEYNASDSGGRIAEFKDNNILFSTGTFRYRDHAQDPASHLGKILSIDKNTALAEVISMGHRNVMGLTYYKSLDQIWSTEHGPNGGDEINMNQLDNSIDTKNFGWPVSSYGEHYSASSTNPEGVVLFDKDDKTYLKAPLHKSHKDFGFVEPITYFTPSIGISSIQSIPSNFFHDKDFDLIFGSKGVNKNAADERSLFLLKSSNYTFEKIFTGQRIRDIIYHNDLDIIIFSGETSGMIGIISNREI